MKILEIATLDYDLYDHEVCKDSGCNLQRNVREALVIVSRANLKSPEQPFQFAKQPMQGIQLVQNLNNRRFVRPKLSLSVKGRTLGSLCGFGTTRTCTNAQDSMLVANPATRNSASFGKPLADEQCWESNLIDPSALQKEGTRLRYLCSIAPSEEFHGAAARQILLLVFQERERTFLSIRSLILLVR